MDSVEHLVLPQRTLLVLCGIAGAGKSTFARAFIKEHYAQGLRATSIISSDYCRALLCDDDNNQQVSRDAFDLLYYIMHKRMLLERFTIVDSTALQATTRHKLLELAQSHHYNTCLLIFNTPSTTCVQRDRARVRIVGEEVILYQQNLLRQALVDIPNEEWHQVHILEEYKSLLTTISIGK